MVLDFNTSLFKAVYPQTLKEFYIRVLNRRLPSISERAKLWKLYNLGEEVEYLGSTGQNHAIMDAIWHEAADWL